MDAIFHRTIVRKFLDKPVEKEKIEKILRAAMAAPSAKNQQPWEFYVVTDKEKLVELSKVSPYSMSAKNGPLAFVPCYRTQCPAPAYTHIDLSASVENILLEADALELGAVWLGVCPEEDRIATVRKILDIPDTLVPFAIIPCGYPQKIRPQQDRFEEERIHYVIS